MTSDTIPAAPNPPTDATWDPKSPKFHAYNRFYGLCRAWAEDSVQQRKCTQAAAYKVINKIVDAYHKRDPIDALKSHFNKRVFTDEMRKDQNLPWYALAGLREGDFSLGEVGTYLIYRAELAYRKTEKYTPIPLFEEGKPNPKAVELIKKTLEPVKGFPPENHIQDENVKKEPLLSDSQLEKLFEIMKEKPPFEQQFLLFPQKGKMAEVAWFQGFNVFNRFSMPNGEFMVLLPSFSLMEAFLTVKHGYPVKIDPNLGLTSLTAIFKNALLGTRVMSLSFPGREPPKKADLTDVVGAEFTIPHDWYHVNLATQVPAEHQWGFALLSQFIQEMASEKEFAEAHSLLIRIREVLIDMEHQYYRKELFHPLYEGQEPSTLFWRTLYQAFQKAHESIAIENKESGMEGLLKNQQRVAYHSRIFMRLLDEVVKHRTFFATLGIRFDLALLEQLELLFKREIQTLDPLQQLVYALPQIRSVEIAFAWPDLMKQKKA